jgi:hypothetical protein
MKKCKYCKNVDEITWLGRDLCFDHWLELCRMGKMLFLKKHEPGFSRKIEKQETLMQIREWVEDELSEGRTAKEILTSSRSIWKGYSKTIKGILKTFSKYLKEKYVKSI